MTDSEMGVIPSDEGNTGSAAVGEIKHSPDICSFHLQHLRVDVIVRDPFNMTVPHLGTNVSRN